MVVWWFGNFLPCQTIESKVIAVCKIVGTHVKLIKIGHTMSVDHPRVGTGNLLKIPTGFVPMALDHIIPMGQAGSGW